MEHLEMVQKLHEKAGISLSDAKDALERAEWDMLEALLILEKDGKIPPITASASTTENQSGYQLVTATASKKERKQNSEFNRNAHRFADRLRDFMLKGFTHDFIIRRAGAEIVCVPVILVILIAIFAFYPILVVLLVGLFLDCSYSIEKRSDKSDSSDENNAD